MFIPLYIRPGQAQVDMELQVYADSITAAVNDVTHEDRLRAECNRYHWASNSHLNGQIKPSGTDWTSKYAHQSG